MALDITRAVVVTPIAYSDDPLCVSTAYTYYWKRQKEPPDNSPQLLATLGILAGYTILVVYFTWRICSQKRQRTSPCTRQAIEVTDFSQHSNLGHLSTSVNNSGAMRICHSEEKQFSEEFRTVLEDWNRAYYNQPDENSRTNFIRNNLNWDNLGVVIASEDIRATANIVAAQSTSSKPEGLFVFGHSNNNTALEHKPWSFFSLSQPKAEGDRSVLFSVTNAHPSMTSASNNTFTFLPPVSGSIPANWNTCTYPHLSHPSSTHKISVNNFHHDMPSAKQAEFLTAIATFSKNLPEDISIQDWSTFVRKNYSVLYNNFPSLSIHNSPRRCSNLSRPVKILTPFERQWLLEGKAFLATMMRAAWKADQ